MNNTNSKAGNSNRENSNGRQFGEFTRFRDCFNALRNASQTLENVAKDYDPEDARRATLVGMANTIQLDLLSGLADCVGHEWVEFMANT